MKPWRQKFILPCQEKFEPLHSQKQSYKPKKKGANYAVILQQSAKGQPARPERREKVVCNPQERGTGGRTRGGETGVGRDDAEPQGGRDGRVPAGEGDGASAARRPHGAVRRVGVVLADHHLRGLPRREGGDSRQNQEAQPPLPCRQGNQGRFGEREVPSRRGYDEQEEVAHEIPSARSLKFMLMIP